MFMLDTLFVCFTARKWKAEQVKYQHSKVFYSDISCKDRGRKGNAVEAFQPVVPWEKKNETAEVCGKTKRMLSQWRGKYFQMHNCKHIPSAANPEPSQTAQLRVWKVAKVSVLFERSKWWKREKEYHQIWLIKSIAFFDWFLLPLPFPPHSSPKFTKKNVRSVVHPVTHACMWDVPIGKHLLTAHTCLNPSWPRGSYRFTAGRGCLLQCNYLWSCTDCAHRHCPISYLVTCIASLMLLSIYTIPTWISRDSDLRVSPLSLFLIHNCSPSPLYCAHCLYINTRRKIKGLWWQHSWVYGSFHTNRCYLKHRPARMKTLELKGTFTCDEFKPLLNPHRNCGWLGHA